jgi:predicted RNA-binding Zn ribbon-like protein
MSFLGNNRYGVLRAPGGLSTVQELLNTAGSGNPRLPDLLDDAATADRWLREVHTAFDRSQTMSPASLTESELHTLRELRSSLSAAISTGGDVAPLLANVKLVLNATGWVEPVPQERPCAWLASTVMLESFLAQRSGDWKRLKICANPDCSVSFFDRSRNRSGVWHDVHVCGNAINLKASRSRRRAESAPTNA